MVVPVTITLTPGKGSPVVLSIITPAILPVVPAKIKGAIRKHSIKPKDISLKNVSFRTFHPSFGGCKVNFSYKNRPRIAYTPTSFQGFDFAVDFFADFLLQSIPLLWN
jgi:hypothetical protein